MAEKKSEGVNNGPCSHISFLHGWCLYPFSIYQDILNFETKREEKYMRMLLSFALVLHELKMSRRQNMNEVTSFFRNATCKYKDI